MEKEDNNICHMMETPESKYNGWEVEKGLPERQKAEKV